MVSIIITTRDEDPQMLEATLDGLHQTTRHLTTEVIVVDDGSQIPVSCGSRPVVIVRHPEPRGCCYARRTGALLARGDVLVWLDAHMSFGESWLEQMLVQASADTLLCSPFWTYDLRECMCWGADFQWNATRDYAQGKYPGFGLRHRTDPQAHALVEVPLLIGACYAMRRDSYDKLGGFSPHLRIWGLDEQDISARAWLAGMRVACATHAKVGHFSRAAFPYPVQFEHLEFNQIVLIRSLFEKSTIEELEPYFQPLPAQVEAWLAATDLTAWRKAVQRRRKITDAEFFMRFVPELAKPVVKRRGGKARSA